MASGAPIRLNPELFGLAGGPQDLAGGLAVLPVATADIAQETRQRMQEAIEQRSRRPGAAGPG